MNDKLHQITDEDVQRIIPKDEALLSEEQDTKRSSIAKIDLIRARIKDFLHRGLTLPDIFWDDAKGIIDNKKSVSAEDHRKDKESLMNRVITPLIIQYSALISFLRGLEQSLDKSTFNLISSELSRLWIQNDIKDKKIAALNNRLTLIGNAIMTTKLYQLMVKAPHQNVLKQAWNQIIKEYGEIDPDSNITDDMLKELEDDIKGDDEIEK